MTKPVEAELSPTSDAGAPSRGILHAVRVFPAFRLLMLGTLVSNTAFWMYQVAVGWLALTMTDSAVFVGVAGFVGGIPLLLVALPAGVVIDRYDRRRVLFGAQAGLLLVAALLALLVGGGRVERWSLLVLVAAYGTMMSFVFPTRTAIVPSLVARGDMANAVALNSATQNATRVLGPSLAGVAIALLGIAETFVAAAAMQALALVATARLPALAPPSFPQDTSLRASLLVGWRVVAARPYLAALILLALAPTMLVMPYLNLMPVFARDVLGLGSTGLGVLLAATGLGTVAGSLGVARYTGGAARTRNQVVMALAFTAGVMLFAVTPSVALAVPILFAAGAASAAFLAMNQTALQLSVEDAVRGRVLSIYLLTWGLLPFGQLLVGALAGALGTPLAVILAGAGAGAGIAVMAARFPAPDAAAERVPPPPGPTPIGAPIRSSRSEAP